MIITFLASYLIWLLLAGLGYLWIVDGRIKKEVALHAALAYVIAWGAAEILKNVFNTTRPFVVENLIPLTMSIPHDPAFPSGHTASAFALAFSVSRHNKKIGALFVIIATIIGIARVLAHVHWPIDIVGGAILGITVSLVTEHLHVFPLLKRRS